MSIARTQISQQAVHLPLVKEKDRVSLVLVWEQRSQLVLTAAWFGLLTGVAEVVVLAFKKFLLQQLIGAGLDIVWMAPLADIALFTVVGLGLVVAARFNKNLVTLHVIIFILAFLQFLSVLLMFPWLHRFAVLTLAGGLAVQTARFTVAHSEAFFRLVWNSAGWVLGMVVAIAVGIHAWEITSERRALAALPPAAAGTPNVLLITLDAVRAQNLSLYGYSRPTTPQLERLAKNGVLFERAIATASWTLPSHASMFTGRLPNDLSTSWLRALDQTHLTLAEVLREYGYVTAGFVANTEYCGSETGLGRGFIHYEDYGFSLGQIIQSSTLMERIVNNSTLRHFVNYYDLLNRKRADTLNRNFLNWLTTHDKRPFFAFLNYYDAHEPFVPPKPFDTIFGPIGLRIDPFLTPGGAWSPLDVQNEVKAYDASIRYLDEQLDLLFEELRQQKVLDNTLVIITADHGQEFFEHGVMGHGYSLYQSSLQVPLLVLLPFRVPAGTRIDAAVSLRDVPATVVDLLQVELKARFPGDSLARYWNGVSKSDAIISELEFASGLPSSFPISKGNMKSLIDDGYHYILNGDSNVELYDLRSDPSEMRDLARSERNQQLIERARKSLGTVVTRK